MAQETTEEFSHRFNRAVEGHPLAPPTPHGRQRWVLEKLEKEAGLKVSPNTMSKWFHGSARPRADNIRKIARVLKVDEVWLSMGQKPTSNRAVSMAGAEAAKGAVLVFAGLIEMAGGRVSFASKEQEPVDLQVNMAGKNFGAIVVTFTEQKDKLSVVIPEPVGDSRVFAVSRESGAGMSAGLRFYDLTGVPRDSLGGFSIVQVTKGENSRLSVPSTGQNLEPLDAVEMIADYV